MMKYNYQKLNNIMHCSFEMQSIYATFKGLIKFEVNYYQLWCIS